MEPFFGTNRVGDDMAKFDIPEQKYYRIGEVADLLHVRTSLLRFWESQFPELAPKKTRTGQRLYTDADIELCRRIQHELKDTGMTIKGLRKKMRTKPAESDPDPAPVGSEHGYREELIRVRNELQSLLDELKREK